MKSIFHKKYASILFFLSLIICAVFIVLSWKKNLVIYPGNSIPEWNTDKILFNRNTETHFFEDHGDSINVSFTLQMGDSGQYPFCLTEFLPVSGEHFDISGYDYLNIEIHSETASKATPMVRANIQVEIPGYSEKNNRDSYRIMWFEFPFVKGQREYNLPIEDFITPGWWWTTNKSLEQSALGKPDYRKVTAIQVGAPSHINLDLMQQKTIYKVSLSKNHLKIIVIALLVLTAFYGGVFMITRSAQPEQPVVLPYKKLEIGNILDEEVKRLTEYVQSNFRNPELTLEDLRIALGMSEGKISELFKSAFDTTFKKYLNQVRLQEAKYLLIETDLQVNEIAWKTGYASVTHFNRVFKETEGHSPNQYRKLSRKQA